jgi:hypothetical protein
MSFSHPFELEPDWFGILRQARKNLVLQDKAFFVRMADSKCVRRAADGRVVLFLGLSLDGKHGVKLLRRGN